jgi:hypothetical protein
LSVVNARGLGQNLIEHLQQRTPLTRRLKRQFTNPSNEVAQVDEKPGKESPETSGFSLSFPPPVPFPQASISPTHAAPQHKKTISDQRVKPWWKNRPTLKLWRESRDSERKSPTIPPPHYQGFWQKTRKYSGTSKPTQG